MPWMSIIVWLVTFLLQKSAGASNGAAALAATGAGLATYYLADPSNKDNVFGLTFGDSKATPGSPTITNGSNATTGGLASIGKTFVSEAGSTLRDWGPTGTVGVIAGTTAVSSIKSKWWPWLIGGAAILLLTR